MGIILFALSLMMMVPSPLHPLRNKVVQTWHPNIISLGTRVVELPAAEHTTPEKKPQCSIFGSPAPGAPAPEHTVVSSGPPCSIFGNPPLRPDNNSVPDCWRLKVLDGHLPLLERRIPVLGFVSWQEWKMNPFWSGLTLLTDSCRLHQRRPHGLLEIHFGRTWITAMILPQRVNRYTFRELFGAVIGGRTLSLELDTLAHSYIAYPTQIGSWLGGAVSSLGGARYNLCFWSPLRMCRWRIIEGSLEV